MSIFLLTKVFKKSKKTAPRNVNVQKIDSESRKQAGEERDPAGLKFGIFRILNKNEYFPYFLGRYIAPDSAGIDFVVQIDVIKYKESQRSTLYFSIAANCQEIAFWFIFGTPIPTFKYSIKVSYYRNFSYFWAKYA